MKRTKNVVHNFSLDHRNTHHTLLERVNRFEMSEKFCDVRSYPLNFHHLILLLRSLFEE